MSRIDHLPTAHEAFHRAQTALAAGQSGQARDLLALAHRLAPDQPDIALAMGMAGVRRGDATVAPVLEKLVARHDLREAWLALAALRRQGGDAHGAVEALAWVLSRHALPQDAHVHALCDAVIHGLPAQDRPGWCNMDAIGHVRVGGMVAPDMVLTWRLDGQEIRPRRRKTGWGLPPQWRRARELEVSCQGHALLGSPLRIDRVARVEGCVREEAGQVVGWAWHPADPDHTPELSAINIQDGAIYDIQPDPTLVSRDGLPPLAQPYGFCVHIPAQAVGLVHVRGANGQDVYGSPLDPGAERRSARAAATLIQQRTFSDTPEAHSQKGDLSWMDFPQPAVPADVVGVLAPIENVRGRRGIDIVVPVYGAMHETLNCLASVLASLSEATVRRQARPEVRVVVVNDASPDRALVKALEDMAHHKKITLLHHKVNRGFPSAVNTGLRHADGRDVILLNSDTLVPPGWVQRLRDAAYSAFDIGSVTPLSNDATILSYPARDGGGLTPDLAATTQMDHLAWAANGHEALVDIPTGVGFCMYLRRDCLDATGLLREDVFAQGYGEENDFCLRARYLGWRHVAHTGLFVAHVGGRSFGGARAHLIRRNLKILNRLHPGYDALIAAFEAKDRLKEARRRLDLVRFQSGRLSGGTVLLIAHDGGGGVMRHVRMRAQDLRTQGVRPLLLLPVRELQADQLSTDASHMCRLEDAVTGQTPNLVFALPHDQDALLAVLREEGITRVELHHFIGHHPNVAELHRHLQVPQTLVAHDYALFCPRIALVSGHRRYCGEPDEAACEACIADFGSDLEEDISVADLRQRSASWLRAADWVVAPSMDTAQRMERHFPGIRAQVCPWEADEAAPLRAPSLSHAEDLRICVLGAIGIEKGYDILLACARDAAQRHLPLQFVVVGYTMDDLRLLQTGRVHLTGPYGQAEAVDLVRAQLAWMGWLPSLWPETWSYTLGEMWAAGLPVAAFDLGAPAERIARTGRGALMPLGLPPERINDLFLNWAGRSVAV